MDLIVYSLLKKYIKKSLVGMGALKGAPCQVQSVEKVDGVTTVTLKWKDNEDVNHTTSFDIDDGIGVVGAHTDSDNHLVFEMSDGTEIDVGVITVDAYTKEEIGDIADLPIAGKDVIENISDIYDELMSGGGGGSPAKMLTGTLLASNWVNKAQTVSVNGLQGNENGVIGLSNLATDAEISAARLALITVDGVSGSNVSFKCEEVPSVDINFTILIPGKGGSGGGSAELTEDLTAALTVGGINSGKTYLAGTSLEDIIKDLLNPVMYPTLTAPSGSLSGTGNKLLETGSTLAVTLTATLNRGSINPAYGTSGYRSGAATGYVLNGGTSQTTNTWSETVSASNRTFQAIISYGAGEQPKDSVGNNYSTPLSAGSVTTGTVTYDFVDAMWANTSSIATIAKLSLVAKSTKQRDMVFPAQTVANPEVFDIPASWNVTAVQVKNDLSGAFEDASSQFTVTDVTHNDASGNAVNYKRYTFNMGFDTGARTVRVKWN